MSKYIPVVLLAPKFIVADEPGAVPLYTFVPASVPYIPILYLPFTLIVPSLTIFPVYAFAGLPSPLNPAAIPTAYLSFNGSVGSL